MMFPQITPQQLLMLQLQMEIFQRQFANQGPSWTEMQLGSKKTNKEDILKKMPLLRQANNKAFPCDWPKAKFFTMKSFNEENLFKAIKHNVWCSTAEVNQKLHELYLSVNNKYPVFLLFGVNNTGYFQGVAQMISPVDFKLSFPGWSQRNKWRGLFRIKWIFIKDIPHSTFRSLKNPLNENRPVPIARNGQEIEKSLGSQILKIFAGNENET